ncbi:hypothetical protein JCM10049v2_002857 [Rhodotorula toruloides]
MPAAPEPYIPEASQAPERGARVPPLVDPPSRESATSTSSGDTHGSTVGGDDGRSAVATLHEAEEEAAGGPGGRDKDLEKGATKRDSRGSLSDGGVIVVGWKGDDDPECPLNWPKSRRMLATICVAGFTLLAPLSSSAMAPAALQVAQKLHITNEVEIQMSTSIFVLAFAISPLVFGPASELFGRIRVLQLANVLYLIFNLVCAFATTKSQFIAFRFFAGFGGGAPLAIGAGVLSDLWRPEERGKGAALYSLGPLLGPALGPVIGGWIVQCLPYDGYKWIFWSTTIFSGLIQLLGLIGLRETYSPILLRKKAAALKKSMGLPRDSDRVQTSYEAKAGGRRKTPREVVLHGMLRPFALLAYEPILQLFALYLAVIYGCIYLLLTTMSQLYEGTYGQSTGIASLHYIALALGFMIASQGGARLLDVIYRRLKAREHGPGRPEFRLPLVVPASISLPFGLLLYGWSAEHRLHWIVPGESYIGLVFIGLGMILVFQASTSYLIDTFTLHAASALAASVCLRSICGFAFPLFAPYMFNGIGYGWGCTILAIVTIIVGCPAAPLLYIFGERIRGMSRNAAKGT